MQLTARQATIYIYKKEGMNGYMRGFVPSILHRTLSAGSYLSLLYYTETFMRSMGLFNETQNAFLASSFSRIFLCILSNPLIVVRTRLEVIGFSEYSGVTDAFKQIIMKEGNAGLFTGLRVSLIRDVPFSGLFYPSYNLFKGYYSRFLGPKSEQEEKNLTNMALVTSAASLSACTLCCVITSPVDIIRTRAYF